MQRTRENRLDLLIHQIPDYALFLLDEKGNVSTWNAGAERLKGYSASEIIGSHFSVFYAPADVAAGKPQRALETAARVGTYQDEGLRRRKDGSFFCANVTLSALRDDAGRLCGYAKLTRDVTELKHKEAALRESEAKYRTLFEYSNEAIILTGPEGAILSANPAACKLFGYAVQELASMRQEQLLDDSDPRLEAALAELALTGSTDGALTFIRKSGERFEANFSSRTFADDAGRKKASAVIHDLTERRRLEEELRRNEQRFRLLYEHAPIGIAHFDLQGRWTFVNSKFAEIVGDSPEAVVGRSYIDVVPPEDRHKAAEFMRQLVCGEIDGINRERRILRKDGSMLWVRSTGRILRDESGKPLYGIFVFEDITERKRAEQALRENEEKYRATFEHAPLGIAELTLEGKFIQANPKLLEILDYTSEDVGRLSLDDVIHPADIEGTLANFRRLREGLASSVLMEKRYIRKDRSLVWVNVTSSLRRVSEHVSYIISIIEDITARKRIEEDLKKAFERSRYLANHDSLTGLNNRSRFCEGYRDAQGYAVRDGHLVAIHLLDLDRFKSINDTLGHHVGDLLLQEVAKRITSQIRDTDLAARLGGDEFAIIQTHLAEPRGAGMLANKLVRELGRPYALDGQEVHSGVSIGIAVYPNDATDIEKLVKLADTALYEAKNSGRGVYRFYTEEMGVAARQLHQLEQELARALEENQLCVHYQPQFDLTSGRISGIEALVRWRHPEKGLQAAAEFIDRAEDPGLSMPIEEWVLRTACRQHKNWVDAGHAIPLTINVSSKQLRHTRFLQMLLAVVQETQLPASLLQLEIREAVLSDMKFSRRILDEVKKHGIRLSLDNFGTEMTALSSLDKYPLDIVRPCPALLKNSLVRKPDAVILSAILDVARGLGIASCAEGVEHQAELDFLKAHGCQAAQGYLLSTPLSPEEMTRRLEAQATC